MSRPSDNSPQNPDPFQSHARKIPLSGLSSPQNSNRFQIHAGRNSSFASSTCGGDEKLANNKTEQQDEEPNPSPYCTSLYKLRFGASEYEYPVPAAILRKHQGLSKEIDDFNDWSPGSHIFDIVHENVAHTIIHFLYTAQYSTIYDADDASEDNKIRWKKFELAYHVVGAAKKYGLTDLQALAESSFKEHLEHIPVLVAVEFVAKASNSTPRLACDEAWLTECFESKFQKAYDAFKDVFEGDSYKSRLGKSKSVDRVMFNCMVATFTKEISKKDTELQETRKLAQLHEPAPRQEHDDKTEQALPRLRDLLYHPYSDEPYFGGHYPITTPGPYQEPLPTPASKPADVAGTPATEAALLDDEQAKIFLDAYAKLRANPVMPTKEEQSKHSSDIEAKYHELETRMNKLNRSLNYVHLGKLSDYYPSTLVNRSDSRPSSTIVTPGSSEDGDRLEDMGI